MPKGVNYPLYIPPSCNDVAKLIESFQPAAAVELLWHKVRGGNQEASALLAYIYLRGAAPKSEFPSAYRECKVAAKAGDSYAQLVTAQVLVAAEKYSEAIRWLRLACDRQFPPAFTHLGRLMTNGFGFPHPDRSGGLRMYWSALRRGNVPALILIAKNLADRRNLVARLLGAVLAPIAIVMSAISVGVAPFSLRNFVHIPSDEPPLFSRQEAKSA